MTIARAIPAYAMTAVAGWIDTVGILLFFKELRIFPTYMSGNTTRQFVSVVQGDLRRLSLYGAAIVLFMTGAADALSKRGPWAKVSQPAVIWLSLACGALAGAFSTTLVAETFVLLVPAIVVMLCGLSVGMGWIRNDAQAPPA